MVLAELEVGKVWWAEQKFAEQVVKAVILVRGA